MPNFPPKPPLPPIDNDLFRTVKEYLDKLYYYIIGLQLQAGDGVSITTNTNGQTVSLVPEEILSKMSYYGSFRGNKFTSESFGGSSEALKLVIKEGLVFKDADKVEVEEKEVDVSTTDFTAIDSSPSGDAREEAYVWLEVTVDETLAAEIKSGEEPGFDNNDGKLNYIIGRIIKYPNATPIPYEWHQHWLGDISVTQTRIANCTLLQPVEDPPLEPQTDEEQDAEAPGVYMGLDSGIHKFRRFISAPASSQESEVPIELDENGCLIKVGPVSVSGGGGDYGPVQAVKGDKIWIKVTNQVIGGVNTAVVSHINKAEISGGQTLTLADITTIGIDKNGHIIEVDGSSVIDEDEDPIDVSDCGPFPIFIGDTTIEVIADVIITGFIDDEGGSPETEVCEFELVDIYFHLEKPASTPFATYNGSTGVIQGFITGTADFVKFDGVGVTDDIRASIALLADATNYGIEETNNTILFPPSAYESGSTTLTLTYNVPIADLCVAKVIDICFLESTLAVKDGDPETIPADTDANYDFYITNGGSPHGNAEDYTGRYRIELTWRYGPANTFLIQQEIVTWETVTVTAVDYKGANITLPTADMDIVPEGDEICLTVKVFDLEFNQYVTAWEQTLCRDNIAFCWSDDFAAATLNGTRWTDISTGGAIVTTTGGVLTLDASTGGVDEAQILNQMPEFDDDFEVEVKVNSMSFGAGTQVQDFQLNIKIGGAFHQLQRRRGSGVDTFVWTGGSEVTTDTSFTFKITRVGATVSYFIDGALKGTNTQAGNLGNVRLRCTSNSPAGIVSVADDFVVLKDGVPYCT